MFIQNYLISIKMFMLIIFGFLNRQSLWHQQSRDWMSEVTGDEVREDVRSIAVMF